MSVKEKLVELLKKTEINKINGHTVLAETCFTPNVFENMATNLIAHGVTVQEWISVKDRLPEVTGKYVCCVKEKGGNTWTIPADWSLEMKMWFGEFGEIKNRVTHWMPLPEPPKGE